MSDCVRPRGLLSIDSPIIALGWSSSSPTSVAAKREGGDLDAGAGASLRQACDGSTPWFGTTSSPRPWDRQELRQESEEGNATG